jgi:hypothetical protein
MELKRLGREADHWLQSSAEVENGGAMPSLLHTSSWRGASLITRRDNFNKLNRSTELINKSMGAFGVK